MIRSALLAALLALALTACNKSEEAAEAPAVEAPMPAETAPAPAEEAPAVEPASPESAPAEQAPEPATAEPAPANKDVPAVKTKNRQRVCL